MAIEKTNWEHIVDEYIEIRNEGNFSQKFLREVTNIAQPAIARIETKASCPSLDTLMRLLHPMGYTLAIVPIEDIPESEFKTDALAQYEDSLQLLIEWNQTKRKQPPIPEKYFEKFLEITRKESESQE